MLTKFINPAIFIVIQKSLIAPHYNVPVHENDNLRSPLQRGFSDKIFRPKRPLPDISRNFYLNFD
jgi:hypothetical protein